MLEYLEARAGECLAPSSRKREMGSDGFHRPSEFLRRAGIFRSPKSINNSDAMDDVNRYALVVSQRMPVLLRFGDGRFVFWQAAARFCGTDSYRSGIAANQAK